MSAYGIYAYADFRQWAASYLICVNCFGFRENDFMCTDCHWQLPFCASVCYLCPISAHLCPMRDLVCDAHSDGKFGVTIRQALSGFCCALPGPHDLLVCCAVSFVTLK